MCDLEHCEHLIRTHEARVGAPFDFVSRLRLDVAWEAELPVPTSLGAPATVHVPHMNAQGGTNDKFVMGTRDAMATYLNRTSYFFRNASWYAWLARSSHGHPFAFDCHGNPGSSSGALRPPSCRRAASRTSARATSSRPSQPAATPGRALCRCASSQQRPQASSPATVSAAARVAAAALSHRPSPLALRAATPPSPSGRDAVRIEAVPRRVASLPKEEWMHGVDELGALPLLFALACQRDCRPPPGAPARPPAAAATHPLLLPRHRHRGGRRHRHHHHRRGCIASMASRTAGGRARGGSARTIAAARSSASRTLPRAAACATPTRLARAPRRSARRCRAARRASKSARASPTPRGTAPT